jgi:predicted transcriptional regulator of viral defense system
MITASDKVMRLARTAGILRPRDLDRHGLARKHLGRLVQQGQLNRVARGLYVLADAEPTEHQTLIEVCKRIPKGIVCLFSALRFHALTTQMPFEVWIAIDRTARRPKELCLPIRVVRFSGTALQTGVEWHQVAGGEVRVYSAAKTVADCFKYRNKIGLDVAMEALRDCLRLRKATIDDLWNNAQVCRVANVMKPYLEALA